MKRMTSTKSTGRTLSIKQAAAEIGAPQAAAQVAAGNRRRAEEAKKSEEARKSVRTTSPDTVQEQSGKTDSRREAAYKRRQALKQLSDSLRQMAETGLFPPSEDGTINGLLREYYAQAGHTELKTYEQWREAGYQVKRGEKAILLWAKPKATKESKAAATAAGKSEEEAEKDYFPVAHFFSRLQVHETGADTATC